MEEAEGYQRLMKEYGLTQEEAAARVGKSRPAVANALRLLLLPEEVRSLVEDGTISAGHARAILSLPAARLQKAAAQKIVALRLSVRQAEAMCKRMLQEEEKPEPKPGSPDGRLCRRVRKIPYAPPRPQGPHRQRKAQGTL